MPLYYEGDIDSDYAEAVKDPHTWMIEMLANTAGYGRVQQMAIQPEYDGHSGAVVFPAVKAIVNVTGLFTFCRITQVLWAKRLRDVHNLPIVGAWDITYSEEYALYHTPRS